MLLRYFQVIERQIIITRYAFSYLSLFKLHLIMLLLI